MVLNRKILNELYRDSERAAYDIEEHISANINALSAVSYFVEDENQSYILSRLKEAKNDIDCYMLGILSREGVFYTTENQELDVRGAECFNKVLEGNVVKCEKFVFNDTDCFLYGAPVYKGSVVVGGVCLTDTVSGLADVFFSSEYTNYAIVSKEGAILAEDYNFIEDKGNIGNILSKENIEKYHRAAGENTPVFLRDSIDGEGVRIQVYPLKINDYVLISVLTDSGYRSVLLGYFSCVALTFVVFMAIMLAVIIFSVLFFKKSNISVLGQLERFADASRALKITYIQHGYTRPGNISYSSRALNNAFGYSVAEIESLFKNRFEYLIYNEDRTRVFREFEDFYNSSETRRKISFRIITKSKKTMWYSDEMTKNLKTEQIISLLYPIDDLAETQSRAAFLSKRLDLISRASSYYVFELNLHDRELFVTDNLKERLGYVITAQDCFKASVRERLISPHSHKELEAMIRSYKRGDRSISGNLTVMTADGSFVRFHIEAEVMGAIIKGESRILAIL
ncbi:MAG: PAS domain-containing protein, partial [Clostridiales bacterium]|nr:PAS domain-containing protein [Clostridiales bacterium]